MAATTGLPARLATIGAGILRTRFLMRAPIWIYKAGAAKLLGSRLLMLEHTGRKSGIRRSVVLEVIGHPAPDSYLVAAGFGDKSQWFRNIKANPRVSIHTDRHASAAATARVLTQHEADRTLADYADQHPRAWQRFKPILEKTLGEPISETATRLPIVELRLD
jgi:deazaflavin-dependent oxidoreductase (nitroreductase family)